MRKALLVLTLIGVSVLFLGAAPGVASASNCSVIVPAGAAGIFWQNTWFPGGDLYYQHRAQDCTDVDLVEFAPDHNVVGIVDLSDGLIHYVKSPPTLLDVLCGRQYTTFTGQCGWTGHVPVYCSGQVHVVYSTSRYRIHSKSQQSWGPWHGAGSTNQNIVC